MKKNVFKYRSQDGVTEIHAIEWLPEREVVGVLQICHGMVEYIDRYDEFARYMTNRGFYVTGHDHLGHGQSIQSEEDHGYFQEQNGNRYVIGDIHMLRRKTEKRYPDVPYYMLGHSMGSFLLRQYLTRYGEGLTGAVIMGTGYQPAPVLWLGQTLCKIIAKKKGWRYRSEFVNNLSFGAYNKRFEPGETSKEWITSDKEKLDQYVKDPLCSFMFTIGGYYQMFEGMKVLTRRADTERIPKNLPLLLVSGADDPVGDFGKGVRKVYAGYQKIGIRDVSMKLYQGDRHEILNETDRAKVYEDIYRWICKYM
jgi:alpha-beta hydrolase superfamily lysophospholipase